MSALGSTPLHASGLGGLSPGRALENFVRPPLATQNLAFQGLRYLPPNPPIKGGFCYRRMRKKSALAFFSGKRPGGSTRNSVSFMDTSSRTDCGPPILPRKMPRVKHAGVKVNRRICCTPRAAGAFFSPAPQRNVFSGKALALESSLAFAEDVVTVVRVVRRERFFAQRQSVP